MKVGYKKGAGGILNLLLVPETGLETEFVFMLLYGKDYPLKVEGEIILTDDCVAPQIVLFGNNVSLRDEPSSTVPLRGSDVSCGG